METLLVILLMALSFWLGRRIQHYREWYPSAEAAAGELAKDAVSEVRRLSSRVRPVVRLAVRKIASWFDRFKYPG